MAVLHGPAEHTTPEEQGMWAMFEVFFDTVVLCSLTALVILCTTQGDTETLSLTGAALAAACFSAKLGVIGEWFISISMVVFAFATVIAWYYLGQQAIEDLSFFQDLSGLIFRSSICRRLYQAGSSMDAVGSVEWTDGIF